MAKFNKGDKVIKEGLQHDNKTGVVIGDGIIPQIKGKYLPNGDVDTTNIYRIKFDDGTEDDIPEDLLSLFNEQDK